MQQIGLLAVCKSVGHATLHMRLCICRNADVEDDATAHNNAADAMDEEQGWVLGEFSLLAGLGEREASLPVRKQRLDAERSGGGSQSERDLDRL